MDYKKIIKSRKARTKILRLLSFIPDKPMLKMQYRIKMGRKLDLKNPKRFTEKLQWYKLYYKNPIMIQCVDKYDVREYIKSLGLGDNLNECYGVYSSPDEIDFSKLPNQFVLKDTLGGGGNSVIICKDKASFDIESCKKQMMGWVSTPLIRDGGREWPYYSGKKHRIIIEKYIQSNEDDGGLIDYKFLCFNGKARVLFVLADRTLGDGAGCGLFDMDFNLLPCNELEEKPLKRTIIKPRDFDKMILFVEKIAKAFPEVRVDIYNQNRKILFGEITFYDASGYALYDPDSFDYELGKQFVLPEKIRDEE